MARLTLSLPDELYDVIRADLPALNISGVLHEALRALLDCDHKRLACARCAAPLEHREVVDLALSRFYGDALWELQELVDAGGTAEGAARVLKGVSERHGVSQARTTPLPRPTRAARERAAAARRRGEAID